MAAPSTLLRIALVCLHTSPAAEPGSGDAGGMNVVVLHQAEALASLGHTVDILTRRSSPAVPHSMVLAPGLTLRFLDAGPPEAVAKGEHEAFIEEFRMRTSELERYDIIHSHHWFSGMAALPIARMHEIPHVQSFHSIAADERAPLSAGERPESAGRLAGEAWLARESDAVVAISRSEADTVVMRLGGAADRIAIVPPGVDSGLFRPKAPAASEPLLSAAPADRGYALAAGRLQPLKGLDLAIETIAAVPEMFRPELIIAGEASSDFAGYADELRALAATRGIGRGVHFIGAQSRASMAALLREARVVLIPSHSETYGLVALEAAACGVPVVAAASGGLREAVVSGITGIVVESRDPHEWAAAVSGILSDPEVASRLARSAREHAERLDWPHSAARLATVYGALVNPDATSGRVSLDRTDSGDRPPSPSRPGLPA